MVTLVRQAGVARWRQIADAIMGELSRGVFQPGDKLPTEHELAAQFRVNRHTIRRALATLADSGFLRVEHGRGSFVAEHVLEYALGRRTRFSANVAAQGREPGHRLVASDIVLPSIATERELALDAGSSVVRLETLYVADAVPICLQTSFFPSPRFDGLLDVYEEVGSTTRALQRLGVADYTRKVTRIVARLPTERESRHLQQPPGRPVLELESVNVDADSTPIQHALSVFAGDRVQMTVEPD